MKWKVLLPIMIFGFFTVMSYGCASTGSFGSASQVKATVDRICLDAEFMAGKFDGFYLTRKTTVFTAQQLADITAFQEFCKTPVTARTDYQYGYELGRTADDVMQALMPLLGRDALSIGTSIRLW